MNIDSAIVELNKIVAEREEGSLVIQDERNMRLKISDLRRVLNAIRETKPCVLHEEDDPILKVYEKYRYVELGVMLISEGMEMWQAIRQYAENKGVK